MKKLGFFIGMLAFVAACSPDKTVAVGEKTTMKINSVYDAKNVASGEVINAKFVVENTGDNPLLLGEVKGTCGCTIAEWSREPIPPGEKGFVKAQVNTHGFSYGPITKSVNITSNTVPSRTTVVVKANIIK